MPIGIEPSPGQRSGDAGLPPIRQFDERVGLTRAFADALDDPRDPDLTEHPFPEMVRSRVHGILAGYADQNDHDTLRSDPVCKLRADRSPDDADLASQAVEGASPAVGASVPAEALAGPERRRHFRLRRQRDPLGEGHPCTWRTLLIEVAAEVVVRSRRIVIRLSASWPHLGWYRRVCERVLRPVLTAVPHASG